MQRFSAPLRTTLTVVWLWALIVGKLLIPGAAHAQLIDWTDSERGCVAAVEIGDGATVNDVVTIRGLECLLTNILASATTVIGLASFVMLIVGAFLYLTSGGSTKGTEAGKQTITYAVIGIIVAMLAFFVLTFVASFTGVGGILDFNLNIQ